MVDELKKMAKILLTCADYKGKPRCVHSLYEVLSASKTFECVRVRVRTYSSIEFRLATLGRVTFEILSKLQSILQNTIKIINFLCLIN